MNEPEHTPRQNPMVAAFGLGQPLTMSSREIADLCEKRHDNVMRDIKKMIDDLGEDALKFEEVSPDAYGRPQPSYRLPKDLTLTLVAGYNVRLRKRIIDRWLELEGSAPDPMKALNDPATMRSLLLTYSEKVIALEGRVADLSEKGDALDRIAAADGSLNITEASKALQMRRCDLFQWLRTNGWLYRRPGSTYDLGYHSKVSAGLLEHKVTTVNRSDGSEKITEQVRVTAKGLARLAQLIKPPVRLV